MAIRCLSKWKHQQYQIVRDKRSPQNLSGLEVEIMSKHLLLRGDQDNFVFRLAFCQLLLPWVDFDLAARKTVPIPHFGKKILMAVAIENQLAVGGGLLRPV